MGKEQLFRGRAKDYVAGRPGYAEGVLDEMGRRLGLTEKGDGKRIADVGSGTGKFSGQLLMRGYEVYGIEPNEEMRREAEALFQGERRFHSVEGNAEHTGMKSGWFDAVTCAQAFHWFDGDAFQRECRRILNREGMIFLIWNMRDMDAELNRDLYRLFQTHCPDFHGFSAGISEDDERIVRFFGGRYEKMRWNHPIAFTEDQFMARNRSSSYAKKEGEEGFSAFLQDLRRVFRTYETDGRVWMPNETVMYAGTVPDGID